MTIAYSESIPTAFAVAYRDELWHPSGYVPAPSHTPCGATLLPVCPIHTFVHPVEQALLFLMLAHLLRRVRLICMNYEREAYQ
jgi:hypothetical protein